MKKLLRHQALLLLLCACTLSLSGQQVVEVTLQTEFSRQDLRATYPFLDIEYGVRVYKLTYTTTDVFGQPDTASGAFAVPQGDEPLAFPMMVYQHGTSDSPSAVPSNPANGERELLRPLAGLGYFMLAPDYLGLGESRGFHPYVHAGSEASAALDMIRAVHSWVAEEADVTLNDQLFITGYSQGGHAAMALHRAIESDPDSEFTVTAAAPMSGPYSISGSMVEVILSEEPYFFPAYLLNTLLSYNYVYGLYDNLAAVFKPAYVPVAEAYQAYDLTLSQANAALIDSLLSIEGEVVPRLALQDSIIAVLEAGPSDHPLWQAMQDNDVYNWAPVAPTRLFYCRSDDQVSYRNSIVADSIMNLLGAIDTEREDVNPAADHGGCVFPAILATLDFFGSFQAVTTGTREELAGSPYRLFPNPARGDFRVQAPTGDYRLTVRDARGRIQWEQQMDGSGSGAISTGSWPAGIYFVQILPADGRSGRVHALIVQN